MSYDLINYSQKYSLWPTMTYFILKKTAEATNFEFGKYVTHDNLEMTPRTFLQRVSIACYAERCISYDRFCLTV